MYLWAHLIFIAKSRFLNFADWPNIEWNKQLHRPNQFIYSQLDFHPPPNPKLFQKYRVYPRQKSRTSAKIFRDRRFPLFSNLERGTINRLDLVVLWESSFVLWEFSFALWEFSFVLWASCLCCGLFDFDVRFLLSLWSICYAMTNLQLLWQVWATVKL